MTITRYPAGQSIRLTAGTITGESGPEDPVTLDFTIQLPDATDTVIHIGSLTRISTGLFVYYYLPPVGMVGEFNWEAVATTPDAANRDSFIVDPDLVAVAPLPPDVRAWIRAEIGNAPTPTDFDLAVALARIGGKAGVALEVWRGRLADMERTPAALGADGLSLNTAANITAITKRIAKLEILARAEGSYVASPGSGFMTRADRRDIFGHLSESELYALQAVGPFPYGGDGGVL